MSHIMLSQSQSASSLRYGEFKVSQAVMLQCGGDRAGNSQHTSRFPPGGCALLWSCGGLQLFTNFLIYMSAALLAGL